MRRWISRQAEAFRSRLLGGASSPRRSFPPAPEWHRNWNDPAWLEQYLSQGRKDFYREVISMLPASPKRFLDAGCGCGYFLYLVQDAVSFEVSTEFMGIDVSDAAVSIAAKICPDANIILGSLYDIPLVANSADMIVCIEVLEHLFEPKRALDEIVRSMQPGGYLLITVPDGEIDNWEGHNNFWSESAFGDFLRPYQFELRRIENGRTLAAILSK